MDVYKLPLNAVSESISVDKTLISKWRNAKRRISPEYAEKLAKYFYDFDIANGYNYLPEVLAEVYPEFKPGGDKPVTDALVKWLSGFPAKPQTAALPSADAVNTYQTFLGRAGILKAILFLAEELSRYKENSYFYCINAHNVEWFANGSFQKAWTAILGNLFINRGIRLRLVNMMDWRINDIRNIAETILRWDLKGWISSVFYTGTETYGDSFVILVPDYAVLRLSYDESAPDNILGSLFFDKFMLKQQERLCEELYHKGPVMCEYDVFNKNSGLTLLPTGGARYVTALTFPFFPADIEYIKDEYLLPDKKIAAAQEKYPLLFTLPEEEEICYILSHRGLEKALTEDNIKDTVLSQMFKKEITLSKKQMVARLKAIKEQVLRGKAKILILDDDDFFPQLNMITDSRCAFGFYEDRTGIFTNMHLLDFMYEYYEDRWHRLLCSVSEHKMLKTLEKFISGV